MSPSSLTLAQEELADLISHQASHQQFHSAGSSSPMEDVNELDEEDRFRNAQIEAFMRMPTRNLAELRLPPESFDLERATGVKSVIADARNYEMEKNRCKTKDLAAYSSADVQKSSMMTCRNDHDHITGNDEIFLRLWRENRRRQLELTNGNNIQNDQTSSSVDMNGKLDEVDAFGYLEAVEKATKDTVVVVFVCDYECLISSRVESALCQLVEKNPETRFVKVNYLEIDFNRAGVPAILAYRNQGDLFANLTGLLEIIPEEALNSDSLEDLFYAYKIVSRR